MRLQQLIEMELPEKCFFCGEGERRESEHGESVYYGRARQDECGAWALFGGRLFICPSANKKLYLNESLPPKFHNGETYVSLDRDATIEDLEKLLLL